MTLNRLDEKEAKAVNGQVAALSTEAFQLAIGRPSVAVLAAPMPICGGQIPKTQDA